MPSKKTTKQGRPSLYSEDLADTICARLHESDEGELPESLRAICRDDDMPNVSTVTRWLGEYDYFKAQYAYARALRKDALMDRFIYLAQRIRGYAEGSYEIASAVVSAVKAEMDAIKWILSKEFSRDYGDKLHSEITGADGGPIEQEVVITDKVEERIKNIASVVGSMKPPAAYED